MAWLSCETGYNIIVFIELEKQTFRNLLLGNVGALDATSWLVGRVFRWGGKG